MKLTPKNIEEYIDRFLEGETTNEEERAIYRFFREEEVPAQEVSAEEAPVDTTPRAPRKRASKTAEEIANQ